MDLGSHAWGWFGRSAERKIVLDGFFFGGGFQLEELDVFLKGKETIKKQLVWGAPS